MDPPTWTLYSLGLFSQGDFTLLWTGEDDRRGPQVGPTPLFSSPESWGLGLPVTGVLLGKIFYPTKEPLSPPVLRRIVPRNDGLRN